MTVTVRSTDDFSLSFAPQSREEEVKQQLVILIRTIQGECPMYRDFGLDSSWIHMPQQAAETRFATSLREAVLKYCPGMYVENIDFEHDVLNPGTLYPIVEVNFDE